MTSRLNQTGGLPMFANEPETRARATDPETSHQAAESVRGNLRESQETVLELFRTWGPMTDHTMVRKADKLSVRQSPSGLRSRRAELVAMGLLEHTGGWQELPSGRKARVWRLVETI